ncbi:transposase [Burkholderia oklahomensis]|uniref:transposase n=1 Tax=Burkholderia oklahomensis TaxID=342113 RepID=UPI0026555B0B|nr:transposase [Burkholderia oklahomensis]MDN7672372.1 transposase [Burkholderia oklahomensis]
MFFDELNDEEWARLSTLIADEPIRLNRRGRPRAENRVVANAVLWILTTGEPWSKLPGRYPSGPTCRRRFEEWLASGTLGEMVKVLSEESGRAFAYVPPPPEPVAPVRRAESPADCDRLRGVFWQNPESWQLPVAQASVCRPGTGVNVRRFASDEEEGERRDVDASHHHGFTVPGAPVRDHGHGRPPHPASFSFGMHTPQTETYRGYTVYGIAQPVQNLMYRAWAEIVQEDRRVERSGLIGPRFTDAESAEQYALDWARQWIDRQCAGGRDAREASAPAAEQASKSVPTIAGLSALALAETNIKHFAAERRRALADGRGDAPQVQVDRREYAYRVG